MRQGNNFHSYISAGSYTDLFIYCKKIFYFLTLSRRIEWNNRRYIRIKDLQHFLHSDLLIKIALYAALMSCIICFLPEQASALHSFIKNH